MEDRISKFMLKVSKFEFYLINRNVSLAKTRLQNGMSRVEGVDWHLLARSVEQIFPFAEFDFSTSGFEVFRETAPQYLVAQGGFHLKWDSDDDPIDSWGRLLGRSFAQLRNNIAHGNKAHLPAPFTQSRTEQFLDGGERLIDFIAVQVFGDPGWEQPIIYR